MKFYTLILAVFFALSSLASDNNDSLWNVYSNKQDADTNRIGALHRVAWDALKSNPDSAKKLLDIELAYAKKMNSKKYQAKAFSNIGSYYNQKGDVQKGNEYKQKALKLFIEIKNNRGIAMMYLNFGGSFHAAMQFNLARAYFNKAITIYKKEKALKSIASCIDNVGLTYSSQGEYKMAMQHYTAALNMKLKVGNQRQIAISYSNIGFLYSNIVGFSLDSIRQLNIFPFKDSASLITQLLDSAFFYQKRSEIIFDSLNSKYDLAFTYMGLADIHFKRGDLKTAKKDFLIAINLAEELKLHSSLQQSSKALSEVYEKLGQYDSAFYWLNKYIAYKDIVFNNKKQFELGKQLSTYKYEIEKAHTAEIHQLTLDKNQNQIKLLMIAIVVVFLLFFLVFIIYWFRNKLVRQQDFLKGTIQGVEEERERVAKELHDDVGQQLSLIKAELSRTSKNPLVEVVNNAILSVREISKGLYPTVLKSVGLIDAIDNLFESIEKTSTLFSSFEIAKEIEGKLSNDTKLHVYRIVQECVNNTLKHSKTATSFRLILLQKGSVLEMEYMDNGIGFGKKNSKSDVSLHSFKERISLLKGTMKVRKSKKGVSLLFILPLK